PFRRFGGKRRFCKYSTTCIFYVFSGGMDGVPEARLADVEVGDLLRRPQVPISAAHALGARRDEAAQGRALGPATAGEHLRRGLRGVGDGAGKRKVAKYVGLAPPLVLIHQP